MRTVAILLIVVAVAGCNRSGAKSQYQGAPGETVCRPSLFGLRYKCHTNPTLQHTAGPGWGDYLPLCTATGRSEAECKLRYVERYGDGN